MTLKFGQIFLKCVLFMHLLSCDSYKNYSLLNNAKDTVLVKTDQSYDLISEFNNGISIDSSGHLLIKPNQEYVIFKGINNLNASEIPFTYLLVVTNANDTLFSFKDKESILEYFQKQSVLKVE